MFDIIIIGAGTAGLSAAVYCARADMNTLVLEESMQGGQIVTSPLVENYPAIKSVSGVEFVTSLYNQAKELGMNMMTEKVLEIVRNDDDREYPWRVKTAKCDHVCKSVIIATGLVYRELDVPGAEMFKGKGLSYCATCDGAFYKDMDVCVCGGGDTAVLYALFLSKYCGRVNLIHRRERLRASRSMVKAMEKQENIEFIPGCVIEELQSGDDGRLGSVVVSKKDRDEKVTIAAKGLFVAIGHRPVNDIFKDIVAINDDGYIIAGEDCKTDVEGIFVAGDCRTKAVRQLVTAACDGTVAALGAIEHVLYMS